MLTFGVMGNIGSGKSTVCRVLSEMGGYIIDADKLGHEIILRGQPAYDEVLAEFGVDILLESGEIDRKKLGAIAFSEIEKIKKLTEITHKYVVQETIKRIKIITESPGEYKFITIDVPLLFEAGMEKLCDYTFLIRASEEVRIERVINRDNLSPEDALKRSRSRKDAEEYAGDVSYIITNNGDFKDLREQVKRCVQPLI